MRLLSIKQLYTPNPVLHVLLRPSELAHLSNKAAVSYILGGPCFCAPIEH